MQLTRNDDSWLSFTFATTQLRNFPQDIFVNSVQHLPVPVVTHNEQQSVADYAFIQDAIGDMTKVHLVGRKKFSFHLMHWYCDYRGLDSQRPFSIPMCCCLPSYKPQRM